MANPFAFDIHTISSFLSIFLRSNKTFDHNFTAVFGRKSGVEPTHEEAEEHKWGVAVWEVSAFYIVQCSVADMELELMSQRFIGVVPKGVAAD